MSLLRLRTRDRRAIALGLSVVVPVLIYQAAVAPYARSLAQTRELTELGRELLAGERAMIAAAPRYPEQVQDAATALQGWTERLFAGPDLLSASSALANFVAGEAVRSRVLIQESETRASDVDPSGVFTLRISVRGQSDLEGLMELLAALEQSVKLVQVEEFTIRQARSLSDGPSPPDELLDFTAVIAGYGLGGGADDPDGFGITTIGGDP